MLTRFTKCNVRLPTVTLKAHVKIPASFKGIVGAGGGGRYLVNLRSFADEPLAPPPARVADAVTHERFNLHASVHLPAADDLGREHYAGILPHRRSRSRGCAEAEMA